MAAFRQHVAFSAAIGAAYGAGLYFLGFDVSHCLMAGGLCGIAGMFPDLDSSSGKPVQEIFNVLGVIAALFLFHRLRRRTNLEPEMILVAAGCCYFFVRFVVAKVFMYFTVHRGMFHSLPAAVVSGLAAYLVYEGPSPAARLTMAAGVTLGFLSHLVLDEIWSVNVGVTGVSLKSSAGSAIKLFSRSWKATLTCWSLLASLGYVASVQEGLIQAIDPATRWLAQHVFTKTGIDLDGRSADGRPVTAEKSAPPPSTPPASPLTGLGQALKELLPSRSSSPPEYFIIDRDPPPPPSPPKPADDSLPIRLPPPISEWFPLDPAPPPPSRWQPAPPR